MLPHACRVLRTQRETEDTWTLDLKPPANGSSSFEAGQFNMIYAFGVGEVPVSICGDPTREGPLEHTVRSVGAVTAAICASRPGDSPVAPDLARTMAAVPGDAFSIVLAHNPALWPGLARLGADLTLSGHTHHGQLAIPSSAVVRRIRVGQTRLVRAPPLRRGHSRSTSPIRMQAIPSA